MKQSFPASKGRFLSGVLLSSRNAMLAALTILSMASQVSAQVVLPSSSQLPMAEEIVSAFDALFSGPRPGARVVHAKGMLMQGTFLPSEAIGMLSRAEHFAGSEIPVTVRFSNFAGLPAGTDGDPSSSPRGMSIKFLLPDDVDTDIVAHSYNGFPAGTPEDFLGFLQALADADPSVLPEFLDAHPAAEAFVNAPKPPPASYATETYFGVDAFRFTNTAGIGHYGRYRIEPVAGAAYLADDEIAEQSPNYLADEMADRLMREPARFRLMIQLAGPDDDVTDGSIAWPDDRPVVDAGMLILTTVVADSEQIQRALFFTPLNLVPGIAPSADPLLNARTKAYRISFNRRIERNLSETGDSRAEVSN